MKRITMMIFVLIFAMLWVACEKTATESTRPAQNDSPANVSLLSAEAKAKLDAQLKDWKTEIPEVLAIFKAQSTQSPQERKAHVTSAVRAKAAEFKARFQTQMQEIQQKQGDPVTEATQIYVPDHYATIQEAVDAAAPGDEIIVREQEGGYNEGVIVKTDSLTLKAEDDSVFLGAVLFQGVTGGKVDGFFSMGIIVSECTDVAVKNNEVCNGIGIILIGSSNCSVKDNIAAYNTPATYIFVAGGISVLLGSGNLVSGNYALENGGSGIFVASSGNNVNNNLCEANGGGDFLDPIFFNGIFDYAFGYVVSGNNHYANNEATGNLYCGMLLVESDNNKIGPTNTLNENAFFGLYLSDSDYNVVQKNSAHVNGDFDMADEGVGNTFIKNDFGTTLP